MGNKVSLNNPATRIVSLVPSQTELLYDLGLGNEVLGITKFCIHPDKWRKQKTVIGGTKNLHLEEIKALKPDLIIANKEENTENQVSELMKFYPVYVSDVNDLESAFRMMTDLGKLTGRQKETDDILLKAKLAFEHLEKPKEIIKVAYCIWKSPYMWAGNDTFIHNLLAKCGLKNVIDQPRYPEKDLNEIQALEPEIILLSSEPYPFSPKHMDEIEEKFPHSKVMLVNGEMFSWYGSRLIKAVPYFRSFLNQLHSHAI
ncbi:cobalamin-binding protein [Marivirga lumbricoides]|uniref:Cobalamin-binding protein n=1 Tax=Marivirga lumbricoides TaxID=1046115 RepID=A0A2T4DDK0_9BACT|nr:cobalamin-binding protein [Marivirga lumbricoides]